ncbi:hypothetical protein UlMin_008529 [Ulmus minor]
MRDFQGTLDYCGLKDLSFFGENFTWANRQDELTFVQAHLDRFVGELAWKRLFPRAKVTNLQFYHSDHRAIKVLLRGSSVWVTKSPLSCRSRRFYFEKAWVTDDECRNLLESTWQESGIGVDVDHIVARLNLCAEKTGAWGNHKFGKIRREIVKFQKEIEGKN